MLGSGVSEIRKESIVDVMRTAEGRGYNSGRMYVAKHRCDKLGSLIGSVDKGLKRAAFLELTGGCSAHVACKECDVELRRTGVCEK